MKRIICAAMLLLAAFTFSMAQVSSIPAAAGGGGGGGTASTRAQAETGTDNTTMITPLAATYSVASGGACGLVRTSSTVITIFPGATTAHPCVIQVGNVSRRFTASATVTLAASSVSTDASVAHFYMKPNGTLYVGLSSAFTAANVSESGASEETPITAFPSGSVKLGTWLAGTTDDQWDSTGGDGNGGNNYISLRTKTSALAGAGIVITESSDGEETYTTDTATIPTKSEVTTNGLTYATTAGSSTAYTLTTPYAVATANANGVCVLAKIDETSGAAPTLSVNSETERPFYKHNGTSAAGAVASGDLIANQIYEFCYNTSLASGAWVVKNVGGGGGATTRTAELTAHAGSEAGGYTYIGPDWFVVDGLTAPTLSSVANGQEVKETTFELTNGADKWVGYSWRIPASWNGSAVTMKIQYYNGATSGTVLWNVYTACIAPGALALPDLNTQFTTGAVTANPTVSGTSLAYSESSFTLTLNAGPHTCAAGDIMRIKWGRVGTSGSDTAAGVMYVPSISLTWTETL